MHTPKAGPHAADYQPVALIKDRTGAFGGSDEVWIVGVLAWNIGIDIINGVRPGVTRQHSQARQTPGYIHLERVVKRAPIVYVALNYSVRRLRVSRRIRVACHCVLGVPPDPIWPRTIRGLRGPNLTRLGPNKRTRRIDIKRTVDTQRM